VRHTAYFIFAAILSTSAEAQVIADSARDFSGVQGAGGWRYGTCAAPFNAETFQPLEYIDGLWQRPIEGCASLPQIGRTTQRPQGTLGANGSCLGERWIVRRWISPIAGPVRVTVTISDADASMGDGVNFRIRVWDYPTMTFPIANGGSQQINFQQCLQVGMNIDFIIEARSADDRADQTNLEVTVSGLYVSPPVSRTACRGSTVTLTPTLVQFIGIDSFTFRWQREVGAAGSGTFVDLSDGPTGYGSTISGAGTRWLTIQNVRPRDAARYVMKLNHSQCPGPPAQSDPATLTVCAADLDNGSSSGVCDGGVEINDLLYFLNAFETGLPIADLDDGSATGTPDQAITIDDLLYFLARFEAGC